MTDPVLQAVADYLREKDLAVPGGRPVAVEACGYPEGAAYLNLWVKSGKGVVRDSEEFCLSYGGLQDLLGYVYTEGKLSEMRL